MERVFLLIRGCHARSVLAGILSIDNVFDAEDPESGYIRG
jgi:hypothetical protein